MRCIELYSFGVIRSAAAADLRTRIYKPSPGMVTFVARILPKRSPLDHRGGWCLCYTRRSAPIAVVGALCYPGGHSSILIADCQHPHIDTARRTAYTAPIAANAALAVAHKTGPSASENTYALCAIAALNATADLDRWNSRAGDRPVGGAGGVSDQHGGSARGRSTSHRPDPGHP